MAEERLWFCTVEFEPGERGYCYLCEEGSVRVGERVFVPVGQEGEIALGRVVFLECSDAAHAPFPPERCRHVLRPFTPEDQDPPRTAEKRETP